MRGRNHDDFQTLIRLRELQKAEIEMRLSKSMVNLSQLDAFRERSVTLLNDQIEAWKESVSGPSVGLDFARAWASAIHAGEAALARTDLQIDEASTAHSALAAEFAVAGARVDVLAQLRTQAVRRARRRREEAAQADFADRHLFGRLRP